MKEYRSERSCSMLSIITLLAALLLSACAAPTTTMRSAPPPAQEPVQMSAQLIIKFTHALTIEQAPKKLAQLSRQYMVNFQVVREMAGGAFVIKVNDLAGERHLTALMQSLKGRGDVAYVERDSMMQHHVSSPNNSVVR